MRIDYRTTLENGEIRITPYRRIFPFVWTKWFKDKTRGVLRTSITSSSMEEVNKFLKEVAE